MIFFLKHVIEGIKKLFPRHDSVELISLSMGHKEASNNQTTFSIGISLAISLRTIFPWLSQGAP